MGRPRPLDGTCFHLLLENGTLVPLSRSKDNDHRPALAFSTYVDLGREVTTAPALDFCVQIPLCLSGILESAHDGTVYIVYFPVDLPNRVGFAPHFAEEAVPHARLLPTVEATGDGSPGTIAVGQVSSRRPGAQDPSNAIHDGAMILGWALNLRLPWQ